MLLPGLVDQLDEPRGIRRRRPRRRMRGRETDRGTGDEERRHQPTDQPPHVAPSSRDKVRGPAEVSCRDERNAPTASRRGASGWREAGVSVAVTARPVAVAVALPGLTL